MVAGIVMGTIMLKRALECEHDWRPYKDNSTAEPEEQCAKCGIIATAKGKENLAAAQRRASGNPKPSVGDKP